MFFLATAVALSFLGPLVHAQSSNDTALEIAAIEAHFKNADLVPSLLSTFTPTAVMSVTFSGVGATSPGQNLTMQREPLTSHLSLTSRVRLSETSIFAFFFFFRGGVRAGAYYHPRGWQQRRHVHGQLYARHGRCRCRRHERDCRADAPLAR